jgi:butyrate kinase
MERPLQLIINPGSTSTKISLYERTQEVSTQLIEHTPEDLSLFASIADQREYRRGLIEEFLSNNLSGSPDVIMGRGGLLHPLSGGVYEINPQMLSDLESARYGEHASNLGALLAFDLAASHGCPAYIADPVVVDEMDEIARITGLPEFTRKSIFHALNQRIAAREAAQHLGTDYGACSLIVAHLGGGISVGAHRCGKVVDVNNALDGEGPFTPERSGTLPAGDLARYCLSGKTDVKTMIKRICGKGGFVAYLGTNDIRSIVEKYEKHPQGPEGLYLKAMIYQVSKEIGALAAALKGKVDAVVLTGGMANSPLITSMITEAVSFIAQVLVIPGEREMLSLAENGSAVYDGKREVLRYEGI